MHKAVRRVKTRRYPHPQRHYFPRQSSTNRLAAAVESDVNFVDAGVPPPDVRGDARLNRWLRRRGGRREDLVLGGHLPRSAFATRESSLDRSAAAFGDDFVRRGEFIFILFYLYKLYGQME